MKSSDEGIMPVIKNYWADAAAVYSEHIQKEFFEGRDRIWLDLILKNAPEKDVLDILDVGTGPGFFPVILAGAGHRVSAADCTEQMLEEAAANLEAAGVTARLYVTDSHVLDFEADSFDLVVSRNVTWTLYDPVKAFTEWKRVLRPGGRIIIFDANYGMYCFDEKIAAQRERDARLYEEKYGEPAHPDRDEYIDRMFLSDKQRPEWDMDAFTALDMDVCSEKDISQLVGTEKSRLAGSTSPMFMVRAEKKLKK